MAETVDVTGDDRDDGLERATNALRDGQLVVLPTDTSYALAADAFSPTATGRVFRVREGDRASPLPVFVRTHKQLPGLTTLASAVVDRLIAAYWPGPLTIVLPAQPSLRWDLGLTQGTVAVRMPLDDVTLALLKAVGPLAVTSASRRGGAPVTDAKQAREQLGDEVAVYLDDGPRPGTASTIVDCTRREPHVLREGVVATAEVLAVARGEPEPIDPE